MERVKVIRYLIVMIALTFGLAQSTIAKAKKDNTNNKIKDSAEEEPSLQEFRARRRAPEDDPKKDILYYPLYATLAKKPHVKFYSNKEFKGKPAAELRDDGLYIHDKRICKWRKDYYETIDGMVMYPIDDPKVECQGYGLVDSWLSEDGGALQILVDTTTPEYYEIIFNKEKFYINPKELKEFKFRESANKTEAKKDAKNMAEFQKLLKENPSMEKFIKEKRKCITLKDMKCLLPDEDVQQAAISEWLEGVCKYQVADTGDECRPSNPASQNPTFDGETENAFWKGATTCFPEDLSKANIDRTTDGVIVFNMDKKYVGECRVRKDEDEWKIGIGFAPGLD